MHPMHHCLQAFRCKLCNYTAERRRPECAAHPYAVERMEVGGLLAAGCCAKGCTALLFWVWRVGTLGSRRTAAAAAAAAAAPLRAFSLTITDALALVATGHQALVAVRRVPLPLRHAGPALPAQPLRQVSGSEAFAGDVLNCCCCHVWACWESGQMWPAFPDACHAVYCCRCCCRRRRRCCCSEERHASPPLQVQRADRVHRSLYVPPPGGAGARKGAERHRLARQPAGTRQRAEVGQQLVGRQLALRPAGLAQTAFYCNCSST